MVQDSNWHARAQPRLVLSHGREECARRLRPGGCQCDDECETELKRLCAVAAENGAVWRCPSTQVPGQALDYVSSDPPDIPHSFLTTALFSDNFPLPRVACPCFCPTQMLLSRQDPAHILPLYALTQQAQGQRNTEVNMRSPSCLGSLLPVSLTHSAFEQLEAGDCLTHPGGRMCL